MSHIQWWVDQRLVASNICGFFLNTEKHTATPCTLSALGDDAM